MQGILTSINIDIINNCNSNSDNINFNNINTNFINEDNINNGYVANDDKLHIRWNSQRGRIFIDGSHLIHNLELGDEILIDNHAPPLKMFRRQVL